MCFYILLKIDLNYINNDHIFILLKIDLNYIKIWSFFVFFYRIWVDFSFCTIFINFCLYKVVSIKIDENGRLSL